MAIKQEQVVFAVTAVDGVVAAVDRSSGEVRMRSEAASPFADQRLIQPTWSVRDDVAVAVSDDHIWCLDTSGVRWSTSLSTDGAWPEQLSLQDDALISRFHTGTRAIIQRHDLQTGEEVWSRTIKDTWQKPGLVVAGGSVIFHADRKLMGLELATGQERFKMVSAHPRQIEVDPLTLEWRAPYVVVNNSHHIYAADPQTGEEVWRHEELPSAFTIYRVRMRAALGISEGAFQATESLAMASARQSQWMANQTIPGRYADGRASSYVFSPSTRQQMLASASSSEVSASLAGSLADMNMLLAGASQVGDEDLLGIGPAEIPASIVSHTGAQGPLMRKVAQYEGLLSDNATLNIVLIEAASGDITRHPLSPSRMVGCFPRLAVDTEERLIYRIRAQGGLACKEEEWVKVYSF